MVLVYALLALALVVALLAALANPLGDYIFHVFTAEHDLRAERAIYRVIGVDPRKSQSWKAYLRAILAFSLVGLLALYALQRVQAWLPYSLGNANVPAPLAFNTAVSFVANTNWQAYSPEATLGYAVQIAGLTAQNLVSAAVGICVAVALMRGFAWRGSATIGNFWVDLTRCVTRVLLPICVVMGTILIALGVVQNLAGFVETATVSGTTTQTIMQGPVASQEVIKELGTNGGGFFNANAAHPYENPNMWTNLVEILLMLAIPVALTRTFGRMVGDVRQGRALLGAMAALFAASFLALVCFESFSADPLTLLAGGSMEGKESRFGVVWSSLFSTVSTSTSTGAVNAMHDSYTALGGMMLLFNMMLGEVSPGGVGSGLYGLLVMAIVAVFIAGLMVGRTPEYLGKKIGPREMKMASLYFLVMPVLVVTGVALSFAVPAVRESVAGSLNNTGNHGFTEVVYAFTSAANNNGSAFAGLGADTPWFNTALGLAMLLGRFVPIVLVVALAGSLAAQEPVPRTVGTMRTDNALFVFLLVFVIVVVSALTFFPTLALGPLAEGLVM